ncbi:MAG: MFS transporter [Phycisphaerae bacterium]
MTETKPGFVAQIKSFPATFWVANTMEIFERMAWYGFFAVSSLYITGPVETGGLGFTSEQRGQIQAIVPFFLYLMPVLTGALADRYGYKKMFVIAYVGMVLSYYGLGQFKTMPTFLAAFMCVAVAAAIFKPVVVGTVARVTTEGNSRVGFGIFYMMVNVGGFLGPIIAGIVRGMSWSYVFIACSGWAAVNLIIVSFLYQEPTTEAGSAGARAFKKVMDDTVEVLGNLRFFISVFVVLIALLIANQGYEWFAWWPHCVIFVLAWVLLNFVWDWTLPKGSGRPGFQGGKRRNPLLKRMHCGNWRFALFLLIMSGFWTSFNQIFLTMPEYIRDYTDTKRMVHVGRAVFGWLGKPQWIDGLAAIEESELLAYFDGAIRRARGIDPITEPDERESSADQESARAERIRRLPEDPSLTEQDLDELARLVAEINSPQTENPLDELDLVDGARTMLGYKVRIQPTELGALLAAVPATPQTVADRQLDIAIGSLNRRLEQNGKPGFEKAELPALRTALRALIETHGPVVSPPVVAAAAARDLSTDQRPLEPKDLSIATNSLAYRSLIWDKVDAGRQVNPEHIVNIDALSIVLLQVLVSFLMARFHRFTAMVIGMLVAAVGIGLSAAAGGTMIGPVGGLLVVVIVGIIIFGIGEMMASPTSQEYVGRIAPKDKVALYMGYYFVSMALGNLFGGILSGQLYGKLARDMQRPDLMWLFFGGLMVLTAFIFLLYDRFVLPRTRAAGEEVNR